MDKIELAKQVFNTEIDALCTMRDALGDAFIQILDFVIACKGKIVLTGIGKPGHICKKLAATLSSLGTPSFFLHPSEAQHGDLGMVASEDIVIAISYSGESEEIIRLLPNIKLIGAKLIGITGNNQSTLAQNCDVSQILPPFEEACPMHLAPTSSTIVELAYGDALAIVAANVYGFRERNYALLHPAGSLGKKLILVVKDLMAAHEMNAVVKADAPLQDAIVEMGTKQLGMVSIEDEQHHLCGIITDGDLRRAFNRRVDIYKLKVKDIVVENPVTIMDTVMAIEALQIMKERNISCMPVLNKEGVIVGGITIAMLINSGLVI